MTLNLTDLESIHLERLSVHTQHHAARRLSSREEVGEVRRGAAYLTTLAEPVVLHRVQSQPGGVFIGAEIGKDAASRGQFPVAALLPHLDLPPVEGQAIRR